MSLSWDEIYKLELKANYPAAIEAIEVRLQANPSDKEAVIRLGFNYWLAIIENDRLDLKISEGKYARRFIELLNDYKKILISDADFCFSYGLGLSLDYYYFAADTNNLEEIESLEMLGKDLLKKAERLVSFYKKFNKGKVEPKEIAKYFSGRGCFLKYYGLV